MGYQVGVTPLQMAAAVGVANGGELVQPRVVRAVIRDRKRLPCRAKSLTRDHQHRRDAHADHGSGRAEGTGKAAQIPGYTVAGKTGTAKKLVNGSYRGHSDYNVSFVGFVPAHKPVFAIVVVVDSPHRVSPAVSSRRQFSRRSPQPLRHYSVPQSIDAPEPLLASRPGDTVEQPASDRSHRRASRRSAGRRPSPYFPISLG